MKLNWFDRWMLRRITRKAVEQGQDHQRNIIEYYKYLSDAAIKEFTEETDHNLLDYLSQCHEGAFDDSLLNDDVTEENSDDITEQDSDVTQASVKTVSMWGEAQR